MDTTRDQRILTFSIGVTVLVSAIGFIGGLVVGSQAILFDGVFSLVDVALTLVALAVLRLLGRERSPRFQYGYWHLEPMVELLGGTIMALACIYALANSIIGLTTGGHAVNAGPALLWASLLCVISLGMAGFVRLWARRLQSPLLWLDARGWLVSGLMSLAVVLAFAIALLLEGGAYAHWAPYLDPLVLAIISAAVLPVPLRSAWNAMRDVLQVAPDTLDARVQTVMEAFVAQHEYLDFSSHVAKIGRMRFVEIHILTRPDTVIGTIGEVDALRNDIAAQLDAGGSDFWLTIDFTADPSWT